MHKSNPNTIPFSLPNGPTFHMVQVTGGQFTMGALKNDKEAFGDEKPRHEVILSDYHIGQHPVTQALYETIMKNNPSEYKGKNRPVEQVSWHDAVLFCNRLSAAIEGATPCYFSDKVFQNPYTDADREKEKHAFLNPKCRGFHLPTEAQWEYAARGGIYWKDGFLYAGGNKLKEIAWYKLNSHNETKPVGLKAANQLGIYDMTGTVWEWCNDIWDGKYYKKCAGSDGKQVVTDPMGADSGPFRVFRGGSFFSYPQHCRVSYRNAYHATYRLDNIGFRLVFSQFGEA